MKNMRVIGSSIKEMEKEEKYIKIIITMMDNGNKISELDMVYFIGRQLKINMKVHG